MFLPFARLAQLAAFLLLCSGLALAQVPKVGGWYEDTHDLGFRIKRPADWVLIPPSPDDGNLIAKFDPDGTVKTVRLGSDGGRDVHLDVHAWLLKFDRRNAAAEKEKGARRSFAAKDIEGWIEANFGKRAAQKSKKDLAVNKVPATEYKYLTPGDEKLSVGVYAMVYKHLADCEIAVVFVAPGDPKKWSKWEQPFDAIARSFAPLATKDQASAATDGSLRETTRAELERKLLSLPGYKLYDSGNYFVITDHKDKAFLQELQDRLERIREIYLRDYPPEKADELRKLGEQAKTGTDSKEEARRKAAAELMGDPRELSRCSVVRVFTDQAAYHSYGGPGGSAGYWSPGDRELVLYDDQQGGGRIDTWRVLNHEAFHQYIFYLYGNLSPHSWYNEGTGDFYSGYQYKNNAFKLEKFLWRTGTIKTAIQEDKIIPLRDFVRLDQAEYYGNNKWGVSGGQNYAQGWSFIYFLRTGKKNGAKNWDPRWDTILDTYFRVLAMSGKLDQAVEEAFQGIDWDALTKSWKEYTN